MVCFLSDAPHPITCRKMVCRLMLKRISAWLLALVLVIAGLPFLASAQEDYTLWKQDDPRWNEKQAWPETRYPEVPFRTLAEGGDQVTALAMLLTQYDMVAEHDFDPWQCLEKLKKAEAFREDGQLLWSRVADAFPGFHFENRVEFSRQKAAALYDYGFPCILALEQPDGSTHYAALQSADEYTVRILDPGSDRVTLPESCPVEAIYYFALRTEEEEIPEYAMFPAPIMEVTQLGYESYSHVISNAIDIIPHGDLIAPFRCTVTFTDPSWGYVVLQSTGKVLYADGTLDYMTVSFVHSEDIMEMVRAQKENRIICQGEPIYRAGGMGRWNPNEFLEHVHLAAYRGHVSGVTEDNYYGCGDVYAYDAFLINPAFTTGYQGRGEGYKSTNSFMYHKAPDDYRGKWKTADFPGSIPPRRNAQPLQTAP